MKLLYGALVLVCTPLVIAGNDAAYPTEKLAAFVVDKVDVTTLPSAIREVGQREKGVRRLRICGARARRKESTSRSAAGSLADFDRSIGSEEIWHLRLHEQPVTK